MNRLYKSLSILIIVSFGFATDSKEGTSETIVLNKASRADIVSEESTEVISRNEVAVPLDIEKIKGLRDGKAKAEKIRAGHLLNKHKNPKPQINNPNHERFAKEKEIQAMIKKESKEDSFFKKFSQSIREKYATMTLPKKEGKRAIKFPTNTQTK
tara:strand:- start:266 stop:730 length:465 start_codon:yes stop_codon:yes gene_type:complete